MVRASITERVLQFLKQDTPPRPHAYADQQGYLRIGLHRSIDYRIGGGLSAFEIEVLARNDLHKVYDDLKTLFAYALTLAEPRAAVLLELAYSDNNGVAGVVRNAALMDAIKQRDYQAAGDTIINSALGVREPTRAARLAAMMTSGEWPI